MWVDRVSKPGPLTYEPYRLRYVAQPVKCLKAADVMENIVDPDQTASDLGLHCLLGLISPKP